MLISNVKRKLAPLNLLIIINFITSQKEGVMKVEIKDNELIIIMPLKPTPSVRYGNLTTSTMFDSKPITIYYWVECLYQTLGENLPP